MISRRIPTYNNLKNIYDIINKIMGDKDVYYNQEEVDKLKEDKTNIFLIKEVKNE